MPAPDDGFRAFIEPELEVLLRVARSLTREVHDAEDLVQDTVLRAWRAFDRFDGRHPRAWLLTILRNTHVNRNRRRRPLIVPVDVLLQVVGPDDVEAEALRRVADPRILAELEALPPRYREAVVAVDLGELTYAEASLLLGVPEGTVMSRVSRARARLRDRLRASR